LFYGNGSSINSVSSTSSAGGVVSINNINASGSSIYMNYFYLVEGNFTNSSRTWIVQDTTGRDYSIWHFFTDLSSYTSNGEGIYGFDDFGKSLLVYVLIFISVGGIAMRYGVGNEATLMGITFGVVYVLDVGLGFVPTISFGGITAIEHFVTFLTFLIFLGFILREESR